MRNAFLTLSAAAIVALPAHAQERSTPPADRRNDCPEVMPHTVRAFSFHTRDDGRAAIGIGTTSGGIRDTLGLLVTEVTSNGPADKAGIEEGDRLQAVNGTELRLAAGDAADHEMRGLMARRLIRALDKVKPGDPVELRVYADGKTRSVKVTTVKASELFGGDAMFGTNGDWLDGTEMARVDRLKTRIEDGLSDLRRRVGSFRYEMGPSAFELESPRDIPPVPPVPPTPPVAPVPPLPAIPPTPPPPPDAPRRIMRIGSPAPRPVQQQDVISM